MYNIMSFDTIPSFFLIPVAMSAVGVFMVAFLYVKLAYCGSSKKRDTTDTTLTTPSSSEEVALTPPADDEYGMRSGSEQPHFCNPTDSAYSNGAGGVHQHSSVDYV